MCRVEAQDDRHDGSLAGGALHGERTAVKFREALGQRQAQTGSLLFEELPVELHVGADAFHLGRVHAVSLVADGEAEHFFLDGASDRHGFSRGRELESVGKQLFGDLPEMFVRNGKRRIRIGEKAQIGAPCIFGSSAVCHVGKTLPEGKCFPLEESSAVYRILAGDFQPRIEEIVFREPGETIGGAENGVQMLVFPGRVHAFPLVPEAFRVGAENGEGREKLMGECPREVAPQFFIPLGCGICLKRLSREPC